MNRDRNTRNPTDPRKEPSPGYAKEQPVPRDKNPKAPGEGRPDEHQNNPAQKPDRET